MPTSPSDDLYEALNAWFDYTQDVPDDDPKRDQEMSNRLARYVGTLEGLIIAITSGDQKATTYATDRLRIGLKAFTN